MRQMLSLASMVVLAHTLMGAAPAKPNTLTPQEIAAGWILLFDGQSTFGWHVDGQAEAKEGKLVIGGEKETTVRTSTEFTYCTLCFDFGFPFGDAALTYFGQRWRLHNWLGGEKEIGKLRNKDDWVASEWQILPSPGEARETHELKGSYGSGAKARAFGMGPDSSWNHGTIGFSVPGGQRLAVRSIKLKPFNPQPIFDGKDLFGWKIHPGMKSKFTVTPEGWLNVKDGKGDLQTEGQWADFVLQCECISNGAHLNSGIFFRARPGEYQQGYEAQIRNQFTAEPTQEYTIEDYDPKTHELTGKHKLKYAAVDYGTGAIYRRMPARKQMSKDHEWFGMTVIAHGRHLATWVNGVQVVDWTDNRPLSDNARKGCCLNKGAMSIQGHDPTTDLSYRNIRLVELPVGKSGN